MNGEVIAIGDELVNGQRLNTNSQWLSQQLGEVGIHVLFHTTVADDLEANVRVFQEAFRRADVVVCTGGLGPTADDLTREALAVAVGVDLLCDETELARIREFFASRKREMPERNVVQAMFPRGSHPVPNPHGTAPGIRISVPRKKGGNTLVFALPGVPAEMRQMWDESVANELLAAHGPARQVVRHHCIRCFGAGESHIEQMLPDLVRRGKKPAVGITASLATITFCVSTAGASPEQCEQAMLPTLNTIRDCLGSLVFGEDDDELQHAVARCLSKRGLSLATAEWGTGGLVAHWLAELPDASTVYRGGLVQAPRPQIPPETAGETAFDTAFAAWAEETMKQIALSVRRQFDADLGLAVSDFPASSADADSPPSFVMALASNRGVEVGTAPYATHPALLTQLSAKRALDFVRLAAPPV